MATPRHTSPVANPTTDHGRYAEWRTSWGLALRLARRDVRRHKGRNAVAMVMVAVPVAILAFILTMIATATLSGTERIPLEIGAAQAVVSSPEPHVIAQDAEETQSGSGVETTAIPGYDREADPFTNAAAIGRYFGGSAVTTVGLQGTILQGDRSRPFRALATDDATALPDGATLLSGRWPSAPGEAVVSPSALDGTLVGPTSLDLTLEGAPTTVDVVGTAEVATPEGGRYSVVLRGDASTATGGRAQWLIDRPTPILWNEVRKANTAGMFVLSAAVLRDPPPESALDLDLVRGGVGGQAQQTRNLTYLGGALLLILTALLSGPAFAVAAARSRRNLALAASNGASTTQLRRTVLAQAMVAGVLAAVVGATLGTLSVLLVRQFSRLSDALGLSNYPFDIPWTAILGITACSAVSAVIAALIPARRLGRLDVVGVMRGQSVSPRPSLVVFLAGAALAVVGGALLLTSLSAPGVQPRNPVGQLLFTFTQGSGETVVVIFGVALILGTLLMVPMVLAGLGHLGHLLPVSLRLAARDMARHRSRSAPTVAAVLAAVAALTIGLVGGASDEESGRRQYVAMNRAGEGRAPVDGDAAAAAHKIGETIPSLVASPVWSIDTGDPWMTGGQPTEPYSVAGVDVVPVGCTPAEAVGSMFDDSGQDPSAAARCSLIGSHGVGNFGQIGILPADEIIRRLDLDGADAARIRDGGAVVMASRSVLTGGSVTLASSTQTLDPASTENPPTPTVTGTTKLSAIEVPLTVANVGLMAGRALLTTPQVATTSHWKLHSDEVLFHDPHGPIDQVTEERVATITPHGVEIERGYRSPLFIVFAVALAAVMLLLLVVVLTSTALNLAEQQVDQATFAALGATRGTRRIMAGAQAFTLAFVGAVLGCAVGLVPGIGITYPLASDNWDPLTGEQVAAHVTTVIPWPWLAVMVVGAPTVAGLLAAAAIRRAPQITRRAT